MVSVVLGGKGSVKKLLFLGGLYIFAIFITYLLAGLGLIYFLSSVPLFVAEYLSLFVGGLVMSIFGRPGITGFDLYSFFVALLGAIVLIWLGRRFA